MTGLFEKWFGSIRATWTGERKRLPYRNVEGRFVTVRRQAGWLKSIVLGKSFRLTAAADEQGNPEYRLEVRA